MSSELERALTALEQDEVQELAWEGERLRQLQELHKVIRDLERFSSRVNTAGLYPGKVYDLKVDVSQAQVKLRLVREQARKLAEQFAREYKEKPKLLLRMQQVISQVEDAFKVLEEHRFDQNDL